jgi:putative two-component system hydrogenase maturation factor HypX/HoxX
MDNSSGTGRLRILLLCSSFNGLCQRVWIELCAAGHRVTVALAADEPTLLATVRAVDPELVLRPYLRQRVPESVWRSRPTVVIHPGPKGDRVRRRWIGPS